MLGTGCTNDLLPEEKKKPPSSTEELTVLVPANISPASRYRTCTSMCQDEGSVHNIPVSYQMRRKQRERACLRPRGSHRSAPTGEDLTFRALSRCRKFQQPDTSHIRRCTTAHLGILAKAGSNGFLWDDFTCSYAEVGVDREDVAEVEAAKTTS